MRIVGVPHGGAPCQYCSASFSASATGFVVGRCGGWSGSRGERRGGQEQRRRQGQREQERGEQTKERGVQTSHAYMLKPRAVQFFLRDG